jgi:hypothetical protein
MTITNDGRNDIGSRAHTLCACRAGCATQDVFVGLALLTADRYLAEEFAVRGSRVNSGNDSASNTGRHQ